MDPLIEYCYHKPDLLRGIITSSDDQLVESFYRLLMHYGCSVQEFFRIGLIESIEDESTALRGNDIMTKLIREYFSKYGGKFGRIVREIQNIAITYRIDRSHRLKKAINATISLLEQTLGSSMSNELLDLCNSICVQMNSRSNRAGENIAASFIFFGILSPMILNSTLSSSSLSLTKDKDMPGNSTKDQTAVIKLTKILSQISAGISDLKVGRLQKYASGWTERFQQIIGLALVRRQQANYAKRNPLSPSEFDRWHGLFIDRLDHYRKTHLYDPEVRRLKHTLSQQEFRTVPSVYINIQETHTCQPQTNRGYLHGRERIKIESRANTLDDLPRFNPTVQEIKEESFVRIGVVPVSFTLERLIEKSRRSRSESSLSDDLRYVVLWTPEDVENVLNQDRISVDFFRQWTIDGQGLLECTENRLTQMNYPGSIQDLLELIEGVKNFAILDPSELPIETIPTWNSREISLWLTLSGMSNLVPIFQQLEITGARFIQLSLNDFREMQINRPEQISKLLQLQNDYAESGERSSDYSEPFDSLPEMDEDDDSDES